MLIIVLQMEHQVEDGIDESLAKDVDRENLPDSRKDVMTLENIIAVSKKALKAEDAELMEKIAKVCGIGSCLQCARTRPCSS